MLVTRTALGISLGFNSGRLCLSLSPRPGSSVQGNVVQYRHNTVRYFPPLLPNPLRGADLVLLQPKPTNSPSQKPAKLGNRWPIAQTLRWYISSRRLPPRSTIPPHVVKHHIPTKKTRNEASTCTETSSRDKSCGVLGFLVLTEDVA